MGKGSAIYIRLFRGSLSGDLKPGFWRRYPRAKIYRYPTLSFHRKKALRKLMR